MLLHPSPRLAEVPGFSRAQLDALARSVELRRQQLESDIAAYITRKQAELRGHEDEVPLPPRVAVCTLPLSRRADSGLARRTLPPLHGMRPSPGGGISHQQPRKC